MSTDRPTTKIVADPKATGNPAWTDLQRRLFAEGRPLMDEAGLEIERLRRWCDRLSKAHSLEMVRADVAEDATMAVDRKTTDLQIAREAMAEALRRYRPSGDVEGALIFFWGASGLTAEQPTEEDMAWARSIVGAEEPDA